MAINNAFIYNLVELRKEYRSLNSNGVAMSSFANAMKLILIMHLITIYPRKKQDKSTVVKKELDRIMFHIKQVTKIF